MSHTKSLIVIIASLALGFSNCSRNAGPDESILASYEHNESADDTAAAAEDSHAVAFPLAEQIAAVKSGVQDTIEVSDSPLSDDDMTEITALKGLRQLKIDRARITEIGLTRLASLKQLEHLRIRETTISERAAATIGSLDRLRILNLPHANFTNDALKQLARLKQLELLRFGSKQVDDNGLQVLAEFPKLRFLHLIDVPISDDGVGVVFTMNNLESFYVDGSQLTDSGIDRLLQRRPNLHCHFDQKHHDRDPQKHPH